MADSKTLLKIKKEMKRKMPEFIRSDYHKKKRLRNSAKWRRPKGITNKMRLQHRGHRVVVKKGYGTPAEIKGVEQDGKKTVVISNVNDLKNIKKDEKAAISSTVGTKKRIAIIEEAIKLKIQIINYKDAQKFKDLALAKISSKKEEQKTKKDERTKKKEEAEKKKQKDDKKTETKETAEDTKKEEKKEKDKVITHK